MPLADLSVFRSCLAILWLVPVAFSWAGDPPSSIMPLTKGARWTYTADVEWRESNSTDTQKATVTWPVEVIDDYHKDSFHAARLRGSVSDLAGYGPSTKPSDHILIQIGSNRLYDITIDVDKAWQALTSSGGRDYLKFLNEGELILEYPLIPDARWGEPAATPQGRYCYVVEGFASFDPTAIPGAPPLSSPQVFQIVYYTTPGHQVIDFVPGLGIVGYISRHHGTPSNAEARLSAFQP